MALNAQITLSILAHETEAGDLSRTLRATPASHAVTLTNGVGAGQAQIVWSGARTISTPGGYEDLNFQALQDDRGQVELTEVVALYIKNTHASSPLLVGQDWNDNEATNTVVWAPLSKQGPFRLPSGAAMFIQPSGAVNSNGERLRISTNEGEQASYEIVVIGKGSVA